MSPILQQARKNYRKVIIIEFCFLIVLSVVLKLLQWDASNDFILGFLSAFIPFTIFVVLLFCGKNYSTTTLAPLYRAEATKFILTIALVITAFKWFEVVSFIAFFTGFIFALALNSILPLCFRKA